MLRRHDKLEKKRPSAVGRMTRTFVSMAFISVFVLSVTYGIKFLSESNPSAELSYLSTQIPKDSKVGQVAGALTKKLEDNTINVQEIENEYENSSTSSKTNTNNDQNPLDPVDTTTSDSPGTDTPQSANTSDSDTVVALFADSHSDSQNLTKAIQTAKVTNAEAIIHMGDHTNLGLTEDLQQSFSILSASGLPFYAIPGDRDLWKTSGPQNFKSVFGENKHTFTLNGNKFVVFDNSPNFSNIPSEDIQWFTQEIKDADFVFLAQPLYHPSNKVMGVFEGEEILNVKKQADQMLDSIRESNVRAVFAAEQHMSSETPDTVKPALTHYVIGAITSTVNEKPQSILQSPRFSILLIKADKSFTVEEKIL